MNIGSLIMLIIFAGLGLATVIFSSTGKRFAKNGGIKFFFVMVGVVLLAYGLVGISGQVGLFTMPEALGGIFLAVGVPGGNQVQGDITCPPGTTLQNGVCVSTAGGGATYQPTAVYSGRNKYSTATISGTSYYKVNGNSATTTAYSNTNIGDKITYWISNGTYWVQPISKTAVQGVNQFEALGYSNSTYALSLYDSVGRATVTNGASNVSMGANDQANIEITYQGTSKGSAGPFGGIMVIETNSTLASVLCTGDVLLSTNPYHLTYTPSVTTHTYRTFAYGPSLDDGSGAVKRIDCQFKNGASAVGDGAVYYVKFIPANYYVTQAGDIVLDTEKYADQDTTRVGSTIALPTAEANWGS